MSQERLLETARRLSDRLTPGDLDATLAQITAAAVEVLPNVQMCSITIRRADGTLETVAPTDEVLTRIDGAQYDLQEGPCYQAATDDRQVISNDLATDPRFPRYGAAAVSEGVRAQIGVRLFDSPRSHGALNLYSEQVGAFDGAGSLSALFAHQAAQAIAYAEEIGNLAEAVRTRTLIGQAVGIVMERYGLNDQRAFAFLQRLSSHRNIKLRIVASEIVESTAKGGDSSQGDPGRQARL
jgi:GAF domain-containing protein